MTLPSFFAASIRAGVTASGGGAAAITRVENAALARTAPVPWSTWRREIEFFIGAPNCRLPSLLCGLAPTRSDTPEIIFYSEGAQPVFRRQPVPIAAKLAASNKTRVRGWRNDGPKVCTRNCAGSGCSSVNGIAHRRAGAGLSLTAGKGDCSLWRRRTCRRDRSPDREHPAGKFRPTLRDREPHRRRRRDRNAGSRQVAARRLYAADDVEHPDGE